MTKILAFLIDPPQQLNPASDTSIAFMQIAQKQGYQIAFFTSAQLFYLQGEVKAQLSFVNINTAQSPWWHTTQSSIMNLCDCDAVLIRKEPPFDQEYLYTTYLLDLVAQQGVLVSNSAQGVRDANEKLFATHFAHLMPDTLVTNQNDLILDFLAKHNKLVLKPLNSMAGQDIVLIDQAQIGVKGVINLLTQNSKQKVMAQQFLPQVMQSDKRIHLLNGDPMPFTLLRTPAKGDFRANLAQGGSGTAMPITKEEQELCQQLKPQLIAKGLDFVGIDIIDNRLIEINVTCTTGIIPIFKQTGFDIGEKWINMIDEKLKNR